MVQKLKDIFGNLEKQTKRIIKVGVQFCFILCIISLAILLTYDFAFSSPSLYDIGITLFNMSAMFAVEFLICGIVVDSLKKRLI